MNKQNKGYSGYFWIQRGDSNYAKLSPLTNVLEVFGVARPQSVERLPAGMSALTPMTHVLPPPQTPSRETR